MKFKKTIAVVLSAMMMTTAAAIPTSVSAASNRYYDQAVELDKLAYNGNDLGANYTPESTTFKVWSPTATRVTLVRYSFGSAEESAAAEVEDVISETAMTKDAATGVWSATVDGDIKNTYYTYKVFCPGSRAETGDIYAKAAGVNGDRSMVVDLSETNPDGWSEDEHVLVPNQTDANIWEVHVKDFSYDASSGVTPEHRGKYLAFTETGTTLNGEEGSVSTCVDYLKEMGIKYVHINPFYDYASVDETGDDTQFNWGYDPKNYNVPEGSYSTNPYDGNVRINEVKQMVMALHKAGIGIIMDVVYNHTFDAETSFFNRTVPNYYYRVHDDGAWASQSGCGNDTASERAMYRKYMIDSVKYWTEEYHIDGFRFDLMGLHDVETMNQIRSTLDEINPDLIMYGEGWEMTSGDAAFYPYPAMANQGSSNILSSRISYFNDQVRDSIKGSVFDATGKGYLQEPSINNMTGVLTGALANAATALAGNWAAQTPEQTVTYDACHDNATLYDRLVASTYGEDEKLYATRYEDLIAENKIAAAIVYTSQGIPFILAGEEFARTKYGDHNSYKSSPEINKLDWNRILDYADLVSYYKGMIQLREAYAPFRDATGEIANKASYAAPRKLPTGCVAYTITDEDAVWKNVAVIFNTSTTEQTLTLTGTDLPQDWVILVNGEQAGVNSLGEINTGAEITIPARTAYVLADKASYEASGIKRDTGKIVVTHKNAYTGEIIKNMVVTGDIGDKYATAPDSTLAIDYDLAQEPDNAIGTYSAETQYIEYDYIPYTLKAYSLSGDGTPANLGDAILIQKYADKLTELTDEQIAIADVDFDGETGFKDAILVQKIALGVPFNAIGTLTVKYIDEATGEEIASPVVTRGRAGSEYSASANSAIGLYVLDNEKAPENATGIYTTGDTVVTYQYFLNAVPRYVHVKLMDGQTWTPNLYTWTSDSGEFTGGWPGTAMTDEDGDGWYDITVNTANGTYNWIINDGSNQTGDMTDYSTDIWVVMKTPTPTRDAADLDIYLNDKPEL